MCNSRGGVEAVLTVAKMGEEEYYFSHGSQTASKDRWWIERIAEKKKWNDLELVDRSDDGAIISVQGPHSRKLLEGVFGEGADFNDEK